MTESYLLIDAADRPRLREELRRLRVGFSEDSVFKVNVHGAQVQTVIKAIDTPLSLVKTHDPSLEDAYLEIVRDS